MTTKAIKYTKKVSRLDIRDAIRKEQTIVINGLTCFPRLHLDNFHLSMPGSASISDFCKAYSFAQQFDDDDLVVRFAGRSLDMRTPKGQLILAFAYSHQGYDMTHVFDEVEAIGLLDEDREHAHRIFETMKQNEVDAT